ncbi:hypothetical protein HMPREF0083_02690 [Aneurinibacillus aneurinilyticus ATCC 12856]|uniref:Uncharacterized protein n=1 Tax=Aneurinibacillus aneurinilyticus ATCC 12856 TaxID=649747 RepID=U1X2H4_ANEAE|nr:hypothetical protein HMPREF0083_02690 [Aneurinibacillus aneurinilyticus ATCC 12856]
MYIKYPACSRFETGKNEATWTPGDEHLYRLCQGLVFNRFFFFQRVVTSSQDNDTFFI